MTDSITVGHEKQIIKHLKAGSGGGGGGGGLYMYRLTPQTASFNSTFKSLTWKHFELVASFNQKSNVKPDKRFWTSRNTNKKLHHLF